MMFTALVLATSMHAQQDHADRVQAAEAFAAADKSTAIALDHPARTHWNFFPGERHGTRLADMTPAQREAAMRLVRALLSQQGWDTVTGIMVVEVELRERSIAAGRGAGNRDPEAYTLAIWGDPTRPHWGSRFEGHHLSVNYTHTPEGSFMTPLFLGAAPKEITEGPRAGTAPLQHIETIALALRNSLSAEQVAEAVISTDRPHDVLLQRGKTDLLKTPQGLAAGTLSGPQRGLLMRLLSAFSGRLAQDMGKAAQQRLLEGGPSAIRLAWIGGTSTDAPRYWRLHGADWVIEFDSVGDDPHHVHCIWHDLRHNFGGDVLKRHLQQHDH